jgi:hypothetical protein
MAKITIKPLSKNDPIFTKSFMTFSKFTNKRRKYENNNSKYKRLLQINIKLVLLKIYMMAEKKV